MDPLSLTANIVTLITVAGSILQYVEKVKSRLNPQFELLSIMNTVTDLQATLIVVRDQHDTLKNSTIPAAMMAYKTLPNTIEKLQKYLDEMVDFAHANLLRNGKGLPRLGLSARRKKQLVDIRDNISDAHRNLRLVLLSANLRQNQGLLSRIEEAVIVQNKNHAETSAMLDRITDQLTTTLDLQVDSLETARFTQNKIRSVLAQSIYQDDDAASTQLRITTNMPLKACDGTCNCQCHVIIRSQTPQWLSAAVGILFYSSTNTPSPDVRPCNATSCFRSQPSSCSRLTYYFPSWMMRTAAVYSTWSSIKGRNSSWFVKIPREIPPDRPCWQFVASGHIEELKELLKSRTVSPYDIMPCGTSLLNWSVINWQVEICSFLMTMGADWNFRDRFGVSAADSAWRKTLSSQHDDRSAIQMQALLGTEDSYDLCLGPLHRIVLGLSKADLQIQIDLEPSRINDRDWLGATPLMWAATRNNPVHLDTLLSRGAQIGLEDFTGLNALHYAVSVGSLECIRALLDAGADPTSAVYTGPVPHNISTAFTCGNPRVEKSVSLLCSYGMNLETKNINGSTNLHSAVYFGSYEAVAVLLKCGADVNALDDHANPPINTAISRGNDRIVQLLCQYGTISCWIPIDSQVKNVLEGAALYGTKKVMDILSESDITPVECNVKELVHLFNTERDLVVGRRSSAEEELAAFNRLLAKKAIALDLAEDSSLPIIQGGELIGEDGQKDNNDAKDDQDQQDDVFEDAVEHLFLLDELGIFGSSPVAAAS